MNNKQTKNQNESSFKSASQWQLMYIKFKRNHLAIAGLVMLMIIYLSAIFAGFVGPYNLTTVHRKYPKAPPLLPKVIDEQGKFHLRPFVYGMKKEVDPRTFQTTYSLDKSQTYPVYFFIQGDEYKFFSLFKTNIHIFGVEEPGKIFIFGTDKNARDLFSRVFHGARISLTVGLVGVFLSLVIGTLLGIASGYWGGLIDTFMQRIIEVILSFPRIPLWLALSAALPANWSPLKIFFGITIVLSLVNWGGLARQLRGKILSMREDEFVLASRAAGGNTFWIIVKHLLPNCLSHIIVIATLSIPSMILGETMLSFLGLGIRPPMTSWGVLLEEAQHTRVLIQTPWMVIPAFFVIFTVLGFNFLGDGLRDAADPYSQ